MQHCLDHILDQLPVAVQSILRPYLSSLLIETLVQLSFLYNVVDTLYVVPAANAVTPIAITIVAANSVATNFLIFLITVILLSSSWY